MYLTYAVSTLLAGVYVVLFVTPTSLKVAVVLMIRAVLMVTKALAIFVDVALSGPGGRRGSGQNSDLADSRDPGGRVGRGGSGDLGCCDRIGGYLRT